MRLLGLELSGVGLPFISAQATHGPRGSTGTVICETQGQCDAIAAWAERENWSITTRVATDAEIADAKYWSERT